MKRARSPAKRFEASVLANAAVNCRVAGLSFVVTVPVPDPNAQAAFQAVSLPNASVGGTG
jgi:hypothetical protein